MQLQVGVHVVRTTLCHRLQLAMPLFMGVYTISTLGSLLSKPRTHDDEINTKVKVSNASNQKLLYTTQLRLEFNMEMLTVLKIAITMLSLSFNIFAEVGKINFGVAYLLSI